VKLTAVSPLLHDVLRRLKFQESRTNTATALRIAGVILTVLSILL
jgi:hypothetical protein